VQKIRWGIAPPRRRLLVRRERTPDDWLAAVTYQAFLLAMMGTPDGKLRKADPAKLASKYSVPLDWAKMSLKHWLGRV
jgi:hypothetical protein